MGPGYRWEKRITQRLSMSKRPSLSCLVRTRLESALALLGPPIKRTDSGIGAALDDGRGFARAQVGPGTATGQRAQARQRIIAGPAGKAPRMPESLGDSMQVSCITHSWKEALWSLQVG